MNGVIEALREKSKNQHQVELKVLGKCPFIVQVGILTITTDENRKVIMQNSDYPTQFTQKAVDVILTMDFKNGNGDVVIPKVYSRVEWYKERLTEITEVIKLLENKTF